MSKSKTSTPREMTTGRALFGFLAPILLLIALIFAGADVTIAVLAAVFLMVIYGAYMNFSWDTMEKAMSSGIGTIATATVIMLLVGCMVASWMASGCIPTLLYYGLQVISPKIFLPICFLLPAFMSVCCGTSWGSISTIGVVLCGMAAGLGIPVGIAAGAVISGSFFGDKMSPLSDTTLLAAATSEVPVFTHITSMFYTTVPCTLIALVLYIFLGINASGNIDTVAIAALTNGLSSNFNINVLNLLPVVLVLVLSVKKVPAFITFGIGIGAGMIGSMVMQGYSFMDNLNFIMNGFSTDSGVEAVNTLVNRGGLTSMLFLVGILLACGMLSGLFTETKVLTVLVGGILRRVKSPAGILIGVMLSSLVLCIAGGQYPAIAIPAVAFKDACDEMDINRAVLSRTLEDVGTMVAAIVPWSAWVIGYGVLLGTTVRDFIPFTFLCILSPIVALVNILLGIGLFRSSDEVKYRPFWRRPKAELVKAHIASHGKRGGCR